MLLDEISIHSWIISNELKTETGQPLDFHSHRFLFDIYRDETQNIVECKAAQLGLSTMEIFRTFHKAKTQNLDVIYILPTFTDVQDFSGGKTNRIVDNNPILQAWVADKDSTTQKRVGKATIYYRGSWNERQALMIAADWLILDEFDRCKQEVLEQYESRLQHSKHGRKSIFSNPSKPDFGVDKYYKQTDQKKWHVTHSCGETYVMDERCVDFKAEIYRCPKCKGEITDEERRMGEWVATAKGQPNWSGYWIPLWIAPWVSAKKIAEYKRTKTPEYFYNFVAGLPYLGGGNKVTPEMLFSCLSSNVNDQTGRIVIGVDTGTKLWYVVGNKNGIFYNGMCEPISPDSPPGYDPYDEIEKLLDRYPNSVIVSDQGGDLIGIRKLQAKYPGRVFLCFFRRDTKNQQLIRWGENEEFGKVTADRNRCIQLVVDEINDKRFVINGTQSDWMLYGSHWFNIYRTKEDVDENEPSYGWDWVWKRNGDDHLALATIYWRIGMDKYAEALATIIGADDFMSSIPVGRVFRND